MTQPEVAMLILQRAEGGGRRWPLHLEEMRIGRDPGCEIHLPERVVSREHACIKRQDDGYYVHDLGSKNGTFVNGQPVSEGWRLQDGDEVQIALRFRLAFVDAGATAPLTMETPALAPAGDGLRIDRTRRTVEIGGKPLAPPLSVAQYRLLCRLVDSAGAVVGREDVVREVWPEAESSGVTEQAIDALVRRLRERIAEIDPDHAYIITVRGHGFRFENRG